MKNLVMKPALTLAVSLMMLGSLAEVAEAFGTYPATIPTPFNCATCHFNPAGGGPRNVFGAAYASNGRNWVGVCDLDSDGDGATNGEELGDPDCQWRRGDPRPMFDATAPGDPNDAPNVPDPVCSDGTANGDEQCDGADLGGESCQSLQFDGGTLRCNNDCTFDTTLCIECGNGDVEGDEQCDGDNLAGNDCQGLGFVGGALGCNNDCTFDTSACEADPDNVCGDNVQGNEEQCDGEDFAGQNCEGLGFLGGALACDSECNFDTSGCEEDLCGNGVINDGEDCDGDNLGGVSCEDEEPGSEGTVTCNEVCEYVFACTPAGAPNNEVNNAPNNEANNAPNNEANNAPNNAPGGEGGGSEGGGGDDEGCAVTPGQSQGHAAFLLMLAGLLVLRRRRR